MCVSIVLTLIFKISCITVLSFTRKNIIKSAVTFFNGIRCEVEYEVYDNETDALCVVGKTTHCFVNNEFRPLRIKKL
jgi:acyl-CoA thioester hydrolase